MAQSASLETAVRTIVRHEVAKVLLPYRDLLRRLTLLITVRRARVGRRRAIRRRRGR